MRRPFGRFTRDESDIPAAQEGKCVVGEPRRVARLQRMSTSPRRDHLEEALRACRVELHPRRELHEDDRELRAEPGHRPVRTLDALSIDIESLEVRDEAVE